MVSLYLNRKIVLLLLGFLLDFLDRKSSLIKLANTKLFYSVINKLVSFNIQNVYLG